MLDTKKLFNGAFHLEPGGFLPSKGVLKILGWQHSPQIDNLMTQMVTHCWVTYLRMKYLTGFQYSLFKWNLEC